MPSKRYDRIHPQVITDLREASNLSRAEFAELCGVSRMTLYRWEAGQSHPLPLYTLRLIEVARQLGKPID